MSSQRMLNKVAFITGGGTGIGAAIARLFAKEGASVLIIGRREDPLKFTCKEIEDFGGQASYFCGDITNSRHVQKAINFTNDSLGHITTLVNSAGVAKRNEDPTKLKETDWQFLINVNIKGVFYTTKYVLQNMLDNNIKGTITNITSISAHRATSGYATYSASKGAVISYTRVIALQYASKGIRANCVSPGIILTPMTYVDRENFDDNSIDRLNQLHPLGRVGTPIDVAYTVLFLSSEESSWITGQDLIVDGGLSIEV